MAKRSTITKIYDYVHKFGVRCCWISGGTAASVIMLKAFEILFFPKDLTVEDLPEFKRIMALKEKENEELMKE